MDKGFFGDFFDANHDGKLNFAERALDTMAFDEMMRQSEQTKKEKEDKSRWGSYGSSFDEEE